MATVPNPRTWATGDKITAARANTELRDVGDFLLNGFPHCTVSQSTAQTGWTTATFNAVTFDAEVIDTDSQHDTVTFNSRIVIGTTLGWYLIWGTYAAASNTAGNSRRCGIALNGTLLNSTQMVHSTTADGLATVSVGPFPIQSTAAADYVELHGYLAAGSGTIGTAVSATYRSTLSAMYFRAP